MFELFIVIAIDFYSFFYRSNVITLIVSFLFYSLLNLDKINNFRLFFFSTLLLFPRLHKCMFVILKLVFAAFRLPEIVCNGCKQMKKAAIVFNHFLLRLFQISDCVKWGSVGMNAGLIMMMNRRQPHSASATHWRWTKRESGTEIEGTIHIDACYKKNITIREYSMCSTSTNCYQRMCECVTWDKTNRHFSKLSIFFFERHTHTHTRTHPHNNLSFPKKKKTNLKFFYHTFVIQNLNFSDLFFVCTKNQLLLMDFFNEKWKKKLVKFVMVYNGSFKTWIDQFSPFKRKWLKKKQNKMRKKRVKNSNFHEMYLENLFTPIEMGARVNNIVVSESTEFSRNISALI